MTPRAELNREAVGEFRVEGCGQEITGVVHLWLNILQHVQQGLHLGPFLGKLRRGGDEVLPGLGEVAVSVGPLWQHEGNEPRLQVSLGHAYRDSEYSPVILNAV